MPIYLYQCPCGASAEFIEPYAVRTLRRCHCGRLMSRQVTSSAFVLQGSGWAKDGYSAGGGDAA